MSILNAITAGAGGVALTGDTSGNLTIQSAGSNVVTFTSTGMVTNVGAPAFMAYAASGTTLTTGTFTKLGFDTETVDTNNNFASSTFTPTVPGLYLLTCCARLDSNTTYEWYTSIYKNGSLYRVLHDFQIQQYGVACSTLVQANGTTDYFEVYGFQNSGSNKTTATGQNQMYYTGFLARTI
jgi:hypothetical protein